MLVSTLKSYKLSDFIDARDLETGRTPLILAMLSSDDGNPSIVRYLKSNKASLTRKDESGCTPLHYAAQNGQD